MDYTPYARQLTAPEEDDVIARRLEQVLIQLQARELFEVAMSKINLRDELLEFVKARVRMIGDESILELPDIDLYTKLEIPPEHADTLKSMFRARVQQETSSCLNQLAENVELLDTWKK